MWNTSYFKRMLIFIPRFKNPDNCVIDMHLRIFVDRVERKFILGINSGYCKPSFSETTYANVLTLIRPLYQDHS